MPGYDEPSPVISSSMTLDQLTAAITDLVRFIAAIQSYLDILPLQPASWPLPQLVVVSLLGYGTTLLPFLDVQPTLQQIEQAWTSRQSRQGRCLPARCLRWCGYRLWRAAY
jgi:hypothetical protein